MKGWKICIAITCGIMILIALVVILAFTVFKPQDLISTVDDISIKNMDVGFSMFTLSMTANVTLGINVSVKNPNKFDLKYNDGSAIVNYRGLQIGEVPIPRGGIKAGETEKVNATLTLLADRLLKHPNIVNDVTSKRLPLNTLMKISGDVNILHIISIHADATLSCDFNINILDKTIENKRCHSMTKIN